MSGKNGTARRPSPEPLEGRALRAGLGTVLTPAITVDDTASGTMEIHVLSQAGAHPFEPVRDLLPGTVRVDGIAYARPTLAADPVDENGDGIPDAVITVHPRGALAVPALGSAVWVAGVDRYRVAGRPVLWDGAAVVTGSGSGGRLGVPVATQSYIGTVGLRTQTNLNLNVISVSPSGGTYGYTVGVDPLILEPGKRVQVTTGPVTYFNTGHNDGKHEITLQIPSGSRFTFNNTGSPYGLSVPGRTVPIYQLVYTGTGNNYSLQPVQG